MADELAPRASRFRLKTILIIAGASLAGIGATMAATALVIIKVDRVHKVWCDRVHLLCAKAIAAPVVVARPKPPEGCPDFLLRGRLVPRGQDNLAAEVRAALRGKVSLTIKDQVDSGQSDVTCFDNRFLASFTEMQQGVTYQCMGVIEGATFSGVCDRSRPGRVDIAGEFFDDAKLRGEIEDRRTRPVVTDAAEAAAQKAMDAASEEVKKAQKASKGHKGGEKKEGETAKEGEAPKEGQAAKEGEAGSKDAAPPAEKADGKPEDGHAPG